MIQFLSQDNTVLCPLLAMRAPASAEYSLLCCSSAVYFDSPDLGVYHTRLARLDGAKLVRVR
jgi:SPX domain protein involved in polyphosphate accumulation